MERRKLGRCGLSVPVVGLGTWKVFDVKDDVGEARCEAIVDAALASGGELFEASPMYGEAERVLARALDGRRDRALIATKVWARTRAVGEQQIDRALARFGTVDIYAFHNLLAVDDHLPRLRELKQAGRIRAIGASHFLPSGVPALIDAVHREQVDVVQIPYHPGADSGTADLLAEAERLEVGVIAMQPFAGGRLLERAPDEAALAALAGFGVHTWAQAILKWTLSDRRVHAVTLGTSRPEHVEEAARASEPPWFGPEERAYVARLAGVGDLSGSS